MDLVNQQYWDASYSNFQYFIAEDNITKWLDQYEGLLPKGGRMFEFGCFPGRYMAHLGKKGLEVNGMDLVPNMDEGFSNWLQSLGIATGKLERGDVLAYAADTDDRYDVVCSFGFIEHFRNFSEIIALHHRILKPGGLLIITTPNFRGGLQQFLRSSLDKENLGRHYIPSMQPSLWERQLQALGYKVPYAGCFGKFDFWHDPQERNIFQKAGLQVAYKLIPLLKPLPDGTFHSPYCGILAQKTSA
jgi:SAM-dependent methyltransferase